MLLPSKSFTSPRYFQDIEPANRKFAGLDEETAIKFVSTNIEKMLGLNKKDEGREERCIRGTIVS